MGFSPTEVNQMSVWQFMAAVEGYVKANTPKDNGKLTGAEKDDLAGWLGI